MPLIRSTSLLRSNELFGALTDGELEKLSPLCNEFTVAQDGLLFNEGRVASHLYIVMEGQIALHKAIRAPQARLPRRTTVAICRAGAVLGWSALVEPYKYSLSAVAWESSNLIRIDSKLFRKALEMYPGIGFKVMRSLSTVISDRLRACE